MAPIPSAGEKIFITLASRHHGEHRSHLVPAAHRRPAGQGGCRCFIISKIWVTARRQPGRAQRRLLQQHRGEDGHPDTLAPVPFVSVANGGCRGPAPWQELDGNEADVPTHETRPASRWAARRRDCRRRLSTGSLTPSCGCQSRHWMEIPRIRMRLRCRSSSTPDVAAHADVGQGLLGSDSGSPPAELVLPRPRARQRGGGEWSATRPTSSPDPICKAWAQSGDANDALVPAGLSAAMATPASTRPSSTCVTLRSPASTRHQRNPGARTSCPQADHEGGKPIRELARHGRGKATLQEAQGDSQLSEPAWLLRAALKPAGDRCQGPPQRPDGIELTLLNGTAVARHDRTTYAAHLLLEQAIVARDKLNAILAEKGDLEQRAERRIEPSSPIMQKRPSTTTRCRAPSTSPTAPCPRWQRGRRRSAPASVAPLEAIL